jgi:hypothetical protein
MSASNALMLIMSISVNLSEALMTLAQGVSACVTECLAWRDLDLPPLQCATPARLDPA